MLLACEGDPNFMCLRYEDFVNEPEHYLEQLTKFLDLEPYPARPFADGVRDQHGDLWRSNSSFSNKLGIDPSAAVQYRERLPRDVMAYIETICYPEMRVLKYDFHAIEGYDPRHMTAFQEPFPMIHARFSDAPDYSTGPARLADEQRRVEMLQPGVSLSEAEMRQWYLHPRACHRLREVFA